MLKQLRVFQQRLHEGRHYETLVSRLERINAEDVITMDVAVVPQGASRVFTGSGASNGERRLHGDAQRR